VNGHSMAKDRPGGLRGFAQTRWGKIALVAVSAALVTLTFSSPYAGPLVAIPVFLLVGLALPIYAHQKRPRFLAVSGLVVILIVAPISTVVFTNTILAPVPAAESSTQLPWGNGGPVMENATVAPFTGDANTNFTWKVTIDPSHLSSSLNGTNWSQDRLYLFISTCPGAVDTNASYCGSGYPFTSLNFSFPANYTGTGPVTVTFHHQVGANGVWSWQMGLRLKNSSGNLTTILLVGDPTWNGIEGPIIGGFSTIYVALIADIFLTAFLYLGLPFYFLLLLYMMLKNRERRRIDAATRSAYPPSNSTPSSTLPSGQSSGGQGGEESPNAIGEETCPSCHAVVYPAESKCWKCGQSLNR
jgi:hypothetical protein